MTTSDDDLTCEQAKLERTGRLRWFHWLVVIGSLAVTVHAWNVSRSALDERVSLRFERESERVVELFTEQLQRHADVLQATASYLSARGGDVGHAEWRRYHEGLELPTLFPALPDISVIHYVHSDAAEKFIARKREEYPDYALHPAHDQDFHLPVVHSVESIRAKPLGFDMAYKANRRDAIERALRTGTAQITGPIRLTYSQTTGFLMFAPFYRGDGNDWEGAGSEGMAGAVFALVRAENLAAGALDRDKRPVRVRIYDDGDTLYDESRADADVEPSFARTIVIPQFGREWRFEIESTAAFRSDAASAEPSLILAGGLIINLLLFGLFATLSRANRHALSFAAKLRRQGVALEESNRALESFAYAASHDLKTPLNGVGMLADFIEEDLEELELGDVAANDAALPSIHRNLGRIRRQVHRGHLLIDGILTYSGLGTGEERPGRMDTRELLEGIGETLQVGAGQLVLEGDFPVLVTLETRLSQVLTNLVGNAFKYHRDVANARVVVRVEEAGDRQRFTVEDDGPGIDPAHHERIFELFTTLESREGVDSTGVGLSIVRKIVEDSGGSIRVDSTPGSGATFTFDWPTRVATGDDDVEAPGNVPDRQRDARERRARSSPASARTSSLAVVVQRDGTSACTRQASPARIRRQP